VEETRKVMGLYQRLQTDEALRSEYQQDPEGVFLRETGMSLREAAERAAQLSDDELAAVAGGESYHPCGYCGEWFPFGELVRHTLVCDKK